MSFFDKKFFIYFFLRLDEDLKLNNYFVNSKQNIDLINNTSVIYINMILTEQPRSINIFDINEDSIMTQIWQHSTYNLLANNGIIESANNQHLSKNFDFSLIVMINYLILYFTLIRCVLVFNKN